MKTPNFTIEQSAFLKRLGFRAIFPDDRDPDYCLYTLKISSHPLLKGLIVEVDGRMIDVYCKETVRGTVPGQTVLIASRIFTESKLLALIQYLTADHALS